MALKRKSNGKVWYWQFKYTDVEGNSKTKMISTGVPSEQESEKAKSKARKIGQQKQEAFLKELAKDKKISHREKKVSHANDTVAEYAEYWLKEMKGSVEDNTLVSYASPLRVHIIPLIGHIKLSELDQIDIKEFINAELAECEERQRVIEEREKKAKGKKVTVRNNEKPYFQSIKKHLAIIKMMLDYAVAEMDLQENVAKKVNKQVLKKIPENDFEPEPYDKDEIAKLREAIKGHHLESAIILASYLGLRREEVLGLRWSDIDFENQRVHIRNVCVLVGTEIVYREKTKTKKSKATMHIINSLMNYLLELKEQQEKDRELFGYGYIENDYVCKWSDGKPIKPNNVSQAYKRLLKQIGLRHTRFHDLRHTVGTIILEETGDIKLAQQTLRHTNIETTANIYVKHSEQSISEGLERLDTSLQGSKK